MLPESRADLARDGDSQRDRADENDRVDRRFVTRMQARKPTGKRLSQPATIGKRELPVK